MHGKRSVYSSYPKFTERDNANIAEVDLDDWPVASGKLVDDDGGGGIDGVFAVKKLI